jgi:preprotein translocase subunit SecE
VARNRQRAKDRQAARRAERQKQAGDGAPRAPKRGDEVDPIMGGAPGVVRGDEARADQPEPPHVPIEDPDDREELLHDADLEVGAPPQDLGRTDQTLEHSPLVDEDLEEELDEDYDFEDEEQPYEPETAGPRGVRGGRAGAEAHHRNRLVAFLIAVWAELQRVQWPTRKQLTQMTGIVLMFCLIAGGYLGLLDAIFSRIIQAIL